LRSKAVSENKALRLRGLAGNSSVFHLLKIRSIFQNDVLLTEPITGDKDKQTMDSSRRAKTNWSAGILARVYFTS
jgi:hypothetical protein